jgi:hypothetical protein
MTQFGFIVHYTQPSDRAQAEEAVARKIPDNAIVVMLEHFSPNKRSLNPYARFGIVAAKWYAP